MSDRKIIGHKEYEDNKENVIERVTHIFPRVMWQGFFCKSKKENSLLFINKLSDMVEKNEPDFMIVESFYNFNKTTFEQIFPFDEKATKEQKLLEFKQIDKNEFNTSTVDPQYQKDGYYYIFNKCVIEKEFEVGLKYYFQHNIIPMHNSFPLSQSYDELQYWCCYYNNDKARFEWKKEENNSLDNTFYHHVKNPSKEFKYHCRYNYSLVRIGFEDAVQKGKKGGTLSDYFKEGLEIILKYEHKRHKKHYKFLDHYENVLFGLAEKQRLTYDEKERLKNENKTEPIFDIKNFNETIEEIIKAIDTDKAGAEAEMRRFPFSKKICKDINKRFKDSNGKKRLSIYKKLENILKSNQLSAEDKKKYYELYDKYHILNAKSLDKPLSNDDEERSLYDITSSSQTPKNQISYMTNLPNIISLYCDEFPNEIEYRSWMIKIGSHEFIEYFDELLYQEENLERNKLISEYAKIYGLKTDKNIIAMFKLRAKIVVNRWKKIFDTNEKLSFLNKLITENGISLADISKYYNDKSKSLLNIDIFDCNISENHLLIATVVELLNPENSKNRYMQNYLFKEEIKKSEKPREDEQESRERKKSIIAAMLYNSTFYIYASNWCFFMNLAADLDYSEHKNKKFYVLDQPIERYGPKIFEIGEPMVLEGTGVLTVTGRYIHEDNEGNPGKKIMKTTFNFEFDKELLEGKDVGITIKCYDNIYKECNGKLFNDPKKIVIDSRTLPDGKNKVHKTVDLDFENGFDIYVEKSIL